MLSGKINYVRADYNPLSGLENSIIFQDVLDFNLLGQDLEKADRFWNPIRVDEITLEESTAQRCDKSNDLHAALFCGIDPLCSYNLIGQPSS